MEKILQASQVLKVRDNTPPKPNTAEKLNEVHPDTKYGNVSITSPPGPTPQPRVAR